MANVEPSIEAVISQRWLASGASPDAPAHEASRGLYSFDADPGYGRQTVYFLDASPKRPLLQPNAPPILQRAAGLVRFPTVRFATVTQIELAGLVPLVVGRG
jgi:hypothetical protein